MHYQFEWLLLGPAAFLCFTPSVYTECHSHSHKPSIISSSFWVFLFEGVPHLFSHLHSYSSPFILLNHRSLCSEPAHCSLKLLYNNLKVFPQSLSKSVTLITIMVGFMCSIKVKKLANESLPLVVLRDQRLENWLLYFSRFTVYFRFGNAQNRWTVLSIS